MHRDFGPLQLAVVVSCLAICPSVAGQQGTQSFPTASNSEPAQSKEAIEERLYQRIVRARYRYFVEFVGREDKQVENGGTARTDYESSISIGDGDESALLQVVLEASPRMIDTWDETDELLQNLLDHRTSLESIETNLKLNELIGEQERLVAEMRSKLQHEGSESLLRKVDAYVFREFIHREAPLSAWLGDIPLLEETPELKKRREEHYHEQVAFATFFQIMGAALDRNNMAREADSTRLLPRCTPKEQREQIISILEKANDDLQLNNFAEDAMIGIYHQNHGPQPVPIAEFTSTTRTEWHTVDEGKQRLRAALGEPIFLTFAREVVDAFGTDLYKEARPSPTVRH